jgi:hypothetical protein
MAAEALFGLAGVIGSPAEELRTAAGDSVWAQDLDSATAASRRIEPLLQRFQHRITQLLPARY